MLILTVRTDKPEAEIALFSNNEQLAHHTWHAHRQLAETIHTKIEVLLKSQNKAWHDLRGIVAFQGPGSFTGLRIGLTVANALAYGLTIPIVATNGENWQSAGTVKLLSGEPDKIALPEYGAPVHITQPQK